MKGPGDSTKERCLRGRYGETRKGGRIRGPSLKSGPMDKFLGRLEPSRVTSGATGAEALRKSQRPRDWTGPEDRRHHLSKEGGAAGGGRESHS